MDVLQNLLKLPEQAFTVLLSDPCLVIGIRRGERGYVPLRRKETEDAARAFAAELNEGFASEAQVLAMEAGSMFGWEIPAADPDVWAARLAKRRGAE